MEPVSAGASVLAFALFGLKSAKIAYEVLSAVKDARTHVAQARNSVSVLQSTLERLTRCRLVADEQDGALLRASKACAEDMERFAGMLKEFEGPHRGAGRQWNKVKVFLKEEELKRMREVVTGHTTALGFHLGVLESEAVWDVRDDVRTVLPVVRDTQTTVLTQQTTLTTLIERSMAQSTDEARTTREIVQNSTQGLVTQADFQQMNGLLEQIRSLCTAAQGNVSPKVVEIPDQGRTQQTIEQTLEDELAASIGVIIEAVQGREGVFALDEARAIGDALLDFFHKAFSSDRLLDLRSTGSNEDSNDSYGLEALQDNLRAVQGAILMSRQIVVNRNDGKRRSHSGTQKIQTLSQTVKFKSFDIGFGTIYLTSIDTQCQNIYHPADIRVQDNLEDEMDRFIEKSAMQISYVPRLRGGYPAKHQGFQAIFHASHDNQGSYPGAIPRLCVNNIIPTNSPVFEVVGNGDLARFEDMLRKGEASLRDQDERGASLLFYAARLQRPAMCRFLLQHGADAEHFAGLPNRPDLTGTALNLLQHKFKINDAVSCQRLIVDAGCDPSIPTIDKDDIALSPMEIALIGGAEEAMRINLSDCTSINIPTNYYTDLGLTPLLLYCRRGRRVTASGLSVLLRHGADVHARDRHGRTCLHHLLRSVHSYLPDRAKCLRLRDACDYLVRCGGADVHAVDGSGCSVSRMAYGGNGYNSKLLGCFFGDVWDRVLAGLGYDVVSFRKKEAGVPRRADYTRQYTRKDFEELWEGMEELCPYYYEGSADGYIFSLPGSTWELGWLFGQYGQYTDDEEGYGSDGEDAGFVDLSELEHSDDGEGGDGRGDMSDDSSDAESEGGCWLE